MQKYLLEKHTQIGLVILAVGCLLVAIWYLAHQQVGTAMLLSQADTHLLELQSEDLTSTTSEVASSTGPDFIFVDVKGAVKQPGVYQFTPGQRVIDAIQAAGGLNEQAAINSINQAQLLVDQMALYVLNETEYQNQGADSTLQGINSSSLSPAASTDVVNINTADLTELQKLPGIGPKKAQQIIDYRHTVGSFKSVEDLKQVNGIGDKTFDSLVDMICVQ